MDISSAKVSKVIVHRVGNKLRDEGINLSPVECQRSSTLDDLLLRHLLAPVVRNGQEYYLMHESDIALNTVNHYAGNVFSNPNKFKECSEAIARHLYICSSHPKIGGGEFLVILFENIRIDDHVFQALGLFRVESKDDYLDVGEENGVIQVTERSGISLGKVQKGAVVLSDGIKVLVVDNLGQKTKYWIDNFLKVSLGQTSKKCAQVAGVLLKAISSKVETPSNALEFSRQVEELLTESDSLSLTDLRQISRNYVDDESVDEILAGAHLKYGISIDDDLPIESKHLARYVKEVVTKARIAEGVSLLVANPDAKIASIDVESTKGGFRAVVEIQLKGV